VICALLVLKLLALPLTGPSAEAAASPEAASAPTASPGAPAGAEAPAAQPSPAPTAVPLAPLSAPAEPSPAPAVAPLAPPPAPVEPGPAPAAAPFATSSAPSNVNDELIGAGYVPGYRMYQGLTLSPLSPRVGAAPGGITPGFAAPMPFGQWTFRYAGFLSASFQSSIGQRSSPAPGQSTTVFHVPPQTLDEYASFVGTNTMPGQWVALNFAYGNGVVTANLSLNTWNPTAPTTYYQIGSQIFLMNAYLEFNIPPLGPLRPRVLVGYFGPYYGSLSEYGLGMYTNPLVGAARGVGELTIVEYRLRPTLTLFVEHGIMGNRNGNVPAGVVPTGGNGSINPIYPSSWIHHAHVMLRRSGDTDIRTGLHYLYNWAQDDRAQQALDNPTTRQLDESYIKDGHITVLGWDATVRNPAWGYLGAGASYVQGENSQPLRGLLTFGGEGPNLVDRWWGPLSHGTGKLMALGFNYNTSLGRMLRSTYSSDAPDVTITAGFVMAYTLTQSLTASGTGPTTGPIAPSPLPEGVDTFNHRLRYKFGVESVYTFLPWMGVALRADRVAPNSKDSGETFYVLAPRLMFRTNWVSRETISIIYGKWFYGPRSHGETGSTVSGDVGLDDQLIAFNVNMWW
jgi:hypothetical protein